MLSASLAQPAVAIPVRHNSVEDDKKAWQAASLLNISDETKELLSLQNSANKGEFLSEDSRARRRALRALVLRRALFGALSVRIACNKIVRELTYTYDLMRKEQRKNDDINAVFNLLNFIQFGTLYSLEGRLELEGRFKTSAILTGVSGGTGILLPTTDILYGKISKARKVKPPEAFASLVSGDAVNTMQLPDIIDRYMDSPEPGSRVSRRNKMHSEWKERYNTDVMTNDALLSLIDGKGKSARELNSRIVHLWSLHTFVQSFDYELVALLDLTAPQEDTGGKPFANSRPPLDSTGKQLRAAIPSLQTGGLACAKLLGIDQELAELVELRSSGNDGTRVEELETIVLHEILAASLQMRSAVDRIYEEMNYAYDVVLLQLLNSRSRKLQKVFEANFIQTGTTASTASLLYLKDHTKTANELFLISNSIGLALTTLALHLTKGGNRKVDTPPNSLAEFFQLSTDKRHKLSPLVIAFLDSPDPHSEKGLTHRQELLNIWARKKVATVDISKPKVKERLASMPDIESDNIKLVRNRITLLDSLRIQLQLMDEELLELLTATSTRANNDTSSGEKTASIEGDRTFRNTAQLLKVDKQTAAWSSLRKNVDSTNPNLTPLYLSLTRAALTGMLEVQATSNNVELDIVNEQTALDSLARKRDLAIELTNIANFYQIGILGVITDGPLGLSSRPKNQTYAQRLQIIEGLTAVGLASTAFLMRKGGIRGQAPQPNMLGTIFDLQSPADNKYTPIVLDYLDLKTTIGAESVTRKEQLIRYWQQSNVLTIGNVANPKKAQKVSAYGKNHHRWNENIKLIRNRVTMLYDLRSIVNIIDEDLALFLKTLG